MTTATTTLFLDLDDTIVDLMGHVSRIAGEELSIGTRFSTELWQRVIEDEHFFLRLNMREDALDLLHYCASLKRKGFVDQVEFLTAIPHDGTVPYAFQDKVDWVRSMVPYLWNVRFGPYSSDKWKHCRAGDILIDDRADNCEEWIAAGGRAHVFRGAEGAIRFLQETLVEKLLDN